MDWAIIQIFTIFIVSSIYFSIISTYKDKFIINFIRQIYYDVTGWDSLNLV